MKSVCRRYTGNKEGTNVLHRSWTRKREKRLLRALRGIPIGSTILDAGCGEGAFSDFLYQHGYKTAGVDISGSSIDQASREKPDIVFWQASLEEDMPFLQDGSYSAVWCSEVLEHLYDVHAALKNLNRVLQQGGLLVLTVPYHGFLKNLSIAAFGFERHYDPYLQHIRFFTLKSLSACLHNAGFCVESSSGIGRLWPFHMSLFVTARKIGSAGENVGLKGTSSEKGRHERHPEREDQT